MQKDVLKAATSVVFTKASNITWCQRYKTQICLPLQENQIRRQENEMQAMTQATTQNIP